MCLTVFEVFLVIWKLMKLTYVNTPPNYIHHAQHVSIQYLRGWSHAELRLSDIHVGRWDHSQRFLHPTNILKHDIIQSIYYPATLNVFHAQDYDQLIAGTWRKVGTTALELGIEEKLIKFTFLLQIIILQSILESIPVWSVCTCPTYNTSMLIPYWELRKLITDS